MAEEGRSGCSLWGLEGCRPSQLWMLDDHPLVTLHLWLQLGTNGWQSEQLACQEGTSLGLPAPKLQPISILWVENLL